MCRRSRVANSMRDVSVSEVILNKSGVAAFIRQIIAGRMPQHMRIDLEIQFRANRISVAISVICYVLAFWVTCSSRI